MNPQKVRHSNCEMIPFPKAICLEASLVSLGQKDPLGHRQSRVEKLESIVSATDIQVSPTEQMGG
jgi:hypothetical protein